jgi:hemerythrin-like metal-binding protein
MEKFIWTEKVSVGVPSIDEQHQRFFAIANEIIDLVEKGGTNRQELLSILSEMGNYAFYHLSTEEYYFDKYGYPDAESHRLAHNLYREEVNKYLNRAREEGADLNRLLLETAGYSGGWLMGHILDADQKYSRFFQEKGIK